MRRIAGGMIVSSVALVLVTGCATRDWVRDLVGKKEVDFDQRIGEQSKRVDGMGSRLTTAETGLGQTGEVARAARERADAAHVRAEDVNTRLSRLWSSRHKRDLVETLQVQFAFDKWDLNDAAQTSIASLVKELYQNPRLMVDLEGYADPVGTYDYNVALSQRRVEAVRRFLVEKGIELPRIHSVGLGPIADRALPDEKKRRVTLRLMVAPD
jgi:outer membrane protein OmpA-like peptidoglycan-associated protein